MRLNTLKFKKIIKNNLLIGYFFLFMAMLSACHTPRVSQSKPYQGTRQKTNSGTINKKAIESGTASWYGPGFQGKKTASGERFNTNDLTAAHRTLPFGTVLIVENQLNGKRVKVRINDRGPYAKNRIIDLSKAAARKIDMLSAGIAKVKLYLVSSTEKELSIENIKKSSYTVQLAAYKDRGLATKKAGKIRDAWVKNVVVKGETVFRVYYGKFENSEQAKIAKNKIERQGLKGFVKQIEN